MSLGNRSRYPYGDFPRVPQAQTHRVILNPRTGPLPMNTGGHYIGWDADHRPYVLLLSKDKTWFAVGINSEHLPVCIKLEGEYADLIKSWALSPMGPDPDAFDREMKLKELVSQNGQPNIASQVTYGHGAVAPPPPVHDLWEELEKTKTSLMRQLVDSITGKKDGR